MSITSRGFNFKNTVINRQQRYIESTTAQIEDQHVSLALSFFIKSVSNSGSSWFVDNSQNVQSRNGSSIFGRLSLSIIEIRGNCDNCVVNWFRNEIFRNLFHFRKNHGRDFFRVEGLFLSLEFHNELWFVVWSGNYFERPKNHIFLDNCVFELSTDESFSIEDGIGRVSSGLVFSGVSDQSFILSECNIGWGGSVTLVISNYFDFVVLEVTYARVGGTEIDTDSDSFNFFVSHFRVI